MVRSVTLVCSALSALLLIGTAAVAEEEKGKQKGKGQYSTGDIKRVVRKLAKAM